MSMQARSALNTAASIVQKAHPNWHRPDHIVRSTVAQFFLRARLSPTTSGGADVFDALVKTGFARGPMKGLVYERTDLVYEAEHFLTEEDRIAAEDAIEDTRGHAAGRTKVHPLKSAKDRLKKALKPAPLTAIAKKKGYGGDIYFKTASANAVWCGEILGQISDGLWEGLEIQHPDSHGQSLFWYALRPSPCKKNIVRRAKTPAPGKSSYYKKSDLFVLLKLDEVVDRMLLLGADARLVESGIIEPYTVFDLKKDLAHIHEAMMSAYKPSACK